MKNEILFLHIALLRILFKHRYFWKIVPMCYARSRLNHPCDCLAFSWASDWHLLKPLWVTVGNWFNIFYSPSSWKFTWIRMAHGSSITITITTPSARPPCFQSSFQACYKQHITCCFWTNSVGASKQHVLFQIFSLSLQIPAWSPLISIRL